MGTDFEALQATIDTMALSDDDKALVKASLWTQGELPEVTSQAQADAYLALSDQMAAGLPARGDPAFPVAFLEWSGSREGILSAAYRAKVIEWEEREA